MDISNLLGIIIWVIFIFAIFDLIVWVSNDAINFLSPSVWAKAASYKTIIIIASLWLLAWAVFSSWLMEVARKWIFYPENFTMMEITVLFLSVIIADILLLNKFNSLGMPTSTTVSIVFCLLGGAVGMWVVKLRSEWLAMSELATLINTAKVLTIILWILWSVLAAFLLWSIVQFVTRICFTFDYKTKPKLWSAVLWAIAFTAISHFIIAKGLKWSALGGYSDVIWWTNSHLLSFIVWASVFWFILMQILLFFKINIFKLVVLVWTFSLAMAFAGNDLVNFIWVPLAALKSYQLFMLEPFITDPNIFYMWGLNTKEQANIFLLLAAWAIMVTTLVFSKKAKKVLSTGLKLSRQHKGDEDFGSSRVAEVMVKQCSSLIHTFASLAPKGVSKFVAGRFKSVKAQDKSIEFDLIRAAVILMCSSVLISIATAYKLPLSTTYVTFMVAMWAAFADRSWWKESAVYRVNWVISVIFWWFLTAFWAFLLAFTLANFIYFGGVIGMWVLIIYTCYVMIYPLLIRKKKS